MTFEKTTAHLGILKYTFTFEGHEGVCFIDVEPGDYSNSNTIISFPEGRYRNIAKISNQVLRTQEGDAIEMLAAACHFSYEKALSLTR